MPYALPLSVATKAKELAQSLRLSPQGHLRVKRTEREWRYRAYQGGEPVTMIDWKQSARSRDLIVREHEPIVSRKVFFWADLTKALPHTQEQTALLFLSLSRMLVRNERTVGWLGLENAESTTLAMIDPLFERGFSQDETSPRLANLRYAIIVMAVDFTATTRQLYDALRTYAAQGNQCVLIDISGKGLHEESVLSRKSWPVYTLDESTGLERLLPLLMDEIMRSTR
ncbi:MAG TPA: hypothetical protein DCY07_06545 [Rhodospirillaceae bacterium]|nr:hypothetical protein [Rhodospirillaceae bacterium]